VLAECWEYCEGASTGNSIAHVDSADIKSVYSGLEDGDSVSCEQQHRCMSNAGTGGDTCLQLGA